jgi:hypothetical protein
MTGYNPSGAMTFPGYGGGSYGFPFMPQQRQGGAGLNPILAQILQMLQQTQQATDTRLAEKSATFDPSAHYNTGGAPPPFFSGLSAMQRYRDMQMRDIARKEAAQAALLAVQEKQAAEPDPNSQFGRRLALAKSGITKTLETTPVSTLQDGTTFGGDTFSTLSHSKYGTGTNKPLALQNIEREAQGLPPLQKSMYIAPPAVPLKGNAVSPMGNAPLVGGDLQEFFQRAVNAGSPNAGVGSLPTPQAGYPGGAKKMTPAEAALWELATKKKK